MLSLETRDVSRLPGRDVWNSWKTKLASSACQSKILSIQKYCAPTLELRFSHLGLLGSSGGWMGLGPTWQKPQDMPTR